jgi:osmoprotectant transport system substrate-binding protein
MKRILTYIGLGLLIVILLLTSCGQRKVTVASKLNTEGAILAQLIIQMLRAELGYENVIDKTWMGSTEELRDALIKGDIDIYPEYTGNGAKFFEVQDTEIWNLGYRPQQQSS